jgi:phosphohistidine phosphatase
MRLYLVQHGEANAKDVDPERHLAEEGKRNAKKMAAFLRPLGLSVAAVWHSGKTRAAETADRFVAALDAAEGVTPRDGLGPKDDVRPVKEKLESGGRDVMIVGHMPFLAKLASLLLTGGEAARPVAFRNAGVLCLEREDESWRVRWLVAPDLLE